MLEFGRGLGIGLLLTMQARGTFIASVFCFVGQLAALPDEFDEYENKMCALLFLGQDGWVAPGCLTHLTDLNYLV